LNGIVLARDTGDEADDGDCFSYMADKRRFGLTFSRSAAVRLLDRERAGTALAPNALMSRAEKNR